MIKIQTLDQIENTEHVVVPTIFPDGTSQVWKLPEVFLNSSAIKATWNFEREDEFLEIASLKTLLNPRYFHLHIPYLPYARQDKPTDNDSTFNLTTFANLLNGLNFDLITSVDVHNEKTTQKFIHKFKNISAVNQINNLAKEYDVVLFPDKGASERYSTKLGNSNQFTCFKKRDQQTGKLLNHECPSLAYPMVNSILIIDDICDGGATFISVAKMLKEQKSNFKIDLYVTHGIFSKGKQILHDAGIQNIYCTNSLLKNTDGFKV